MKRRNFLKMIGVSPLAGLVKAKSGNPPILTPELCTQDYEFIDRDVQSRLGTLVQHRWITDYGWACKQGWSWSDGYRERMLELINEEYDPNFIENLCVKKGVSIFRIIQFPQIICLYYCFPTGAVARVEMTKDMLTE